MTRLVGKVLVLLSVLALTGCGTLGNLAGRDKIYGGTVIDGGSVADACKDIAHRDSPTYTASQVSVMLVYSCIDLPISFALDTVTLPITVPVTCYHWWKGDSATAEAAPVASEPAVIKEVPASPVPPATE
jgi:uncharacterized protein YceK